MMESKSDSSAGNSITYSDNIYSEDYVAQFLDFSNNNYYLSQDVIKPQSFVKSEKSLGTSTLLETSKSYEEIQHKSKSSFHNFQKHLVTTLRHSIDLKEAKFDSETKNVEQILWNFFMKCPKMTRTLIYLIFGGISMECSKARKFNRQYGLERLLRNHTQHSIKKAQKHLRNEILRQLQKLNFQWQLGNRRMKNKQEFKIYFEAFIQQLKDGGFNKRIPKQKKMLAEKKQQTKKQQDFQGLSFNKA